MLRLRTGPECPEDNLRELTCESNLKHGIAREEKKKKKEEREREREKTFPSKALT